MMKCVLVATAAMLSFGAVGAASAQMAPAPRFSVEGYVTYGFFGSLPETSAELEGAVGYGARAAYQLAPQWAAFGNYQRSNPELTGTTGADQNINVDHWAAGVEFSYIPRGGAEGMLPIVLEAGLGQTRYDRAGWDNALAVKLGLSSALQLTRMFAVRYGVDDYISNFQGDGVTNQLFARVGGEVRF